MTSKAMTTDNEVKNTSGIWPTEYRVLVRPIEVEQMAGRGKLIVKPQETAFREQAAQTIGIVIAVGGKAFEDFADEMPDGSLTGIVPEIGDRVLFAQYAGMYISEEQSVDGEEYRILNDKDVLAVFK